MVDPTDRVELTHELIFDFTNMDTNEKGATANVP